jgi:hypothetical protein
MIDLGNAYSDHRHKELDDPRGQIQDLLFQLKVNQTFACSKQRLGGNFRPRLHEEQKSVRFCHLPICVRDSSISFGWMAKIGPIFSVRVIEALIKLLQIKVTLSRLTFGEIFARF